MIEMNIILIIVVVVVVVVVAVAGHPGKTRRRRPSPCRDHGLAPGGEGDICFAASLLLFTTLSAPHFQKH